MILTCEICKTHFIWTRPPGRYGAHPPKICGISDEDGRWVADPACKKARQAKLYANWVKNNPQKAKANQKKQYKKRKDNEKLPAYDSKDVPETQQWPCRRCGEMSSNRINCPACLTILTNRCSMEHPAFIYNQSNDDVDIKKPPSNLIGASCVF